MDFFKAQVYPLNIITVFFVVIAINVYEHFNSVSGIAYVFISFVIWAIFSLLTERFYLKKSPKITYYIVNTFGLTALLIVLTYILKVVFGI
jgi:hypothetical protein